MIFKCVAAHLSGPAGLSLPAIVLQVGHIEFLESTVILSLKQIVLDGLNDFAKIKLAS